MYKYTHEHTKLPTDLIRLIGEYLLPSEREIELNRSRLLCEFNFIKEKNNVHRMFYRIRSRQYYYWLNESMKDVVDYLISIELEYPVMAWFETDKYLDYEDEQYANEQKNKGKK